MKHSGNGFNDFYYDDGASSFSNASEFGVESLTVGELTDRIRRVLDGNFGALLVRGEISGFSVVRSGHAYFTLKDDESQLPAMIFSNRLRQLNFRLQNGMKVACMGRLSVYKPYGKYQLIAEDVTELGVGSRERRFRELYAKLEREGIFDRRRLPAPLIVRRVGVVTSPTAAALRDFVNTLASFSKGIDVVLSPTRVQGEGAALEIAHAIRLLSEHAGELGLDAIAVIRGGGSVEDLWEFNEEPAVRAVAASNVPVITGIGHEIDNSLCDFAADIRCTTPTAAASALGNIDRERAAELKEWEDRVAHAVGMRIQNARERLQALEKRPVFHNPGQFLSDRKKELLDQTSRRLAFGIDSVVNRHESRFREAVGRLEAMSPLAVLSRGYSITRYPDSKTIIRDAKEVKNGSVIETRLNAGTLISLVLEGGKRG